MTTKRKFNGTKSQWRKDEETLLKSSGRELRKEQVTGKHEEGGFATPKEHGRILWVWGGFPHFKEPAKRPSKPKYQKNAQEQTIQKERPKTESIHDGEFKVSFGEVFLDSSDKPTICILHLQSHREIIQLILYHRDIEKIKNLGISHNSILHVKNGCLVELNKKIVSYRVKKQTYGLAD